MIYVGLEGKKLRNVRLEWPLFQLPFQFDGQNLTFKTKEILYL